MAWKVELTPEAKRALDSLGKTDARRILKFLFDRVHVGHRSTVYKTKN